MPNHATREIRNVAVVGHGGCGKTTLVESLLVAGGGHRGCRPQVEKGTAVCDYEPEERAHQHSLWSAVASLDHDSAHVSFVDTPGYPDFLGRALPAVAVVETAALVVDARIRSADHHPTDDGGRRRPGSGASRHRQQDRRSGPESRRSGRGNLQEVFGSVCLPINLPAPGREQVVDCFFDPDPAAATEFSSVEEAHTPGWWIRRWRWTRS